MFVSSERASGLQLSQIRTVEENYSTIGEVLDIGAGGIQVPQITTSTDAERVVKMARFAPIGMRGVCRFVRAADYSAMDRFDYFKTANEALIVIQLEGQEAVERLDEILEVEGIDVVFIGPYDLSQSLGLTGQVDHPAVEEKMREIIGQCARKGIITGTFADTFESARKYKEAGVKYVSYSVDMGLFYEYCKYVHSQLHRPVSEKLG